MIETYNDKLIYSGYTKVYLNKGKDMFIDEIKSLNETNPMGELIFDENISIKLPNEKEFNEDKDFFKNKILSERKIKK